MSPARDHRRPVLTVTSGARDVVRAAMGAETDPGSLALWLEVTGAADGAFTYDMYFRATSYADIWDSSRDDDGLSVVIPKDSIERLQGAILDLVPGDGSHERLVVVNPNSPPAPPSGGLAHHRVDLSDPFVRQVVSVLEGQVNPSIAVHGGRADLEAVDGLAVYLRLSGGCQGCGMAKATLAQGIEVMLRGAIPELTAVVDVTDHAGGATPYYDPALS
ncbi:MAG TPA: NifU family protein [Acidimicrobiales bacterium]|nr:NifU family protein [Acidimicrobiales bacterium]